PISFLLIRHLPRPPLFPYTTLFRSSTAATGMSTVTITGTSGTLSHTTTLALTVNTTVSTLTVTPTTLSFNYQIGSAVPGAQSVSDRKSTRLNSSHVAISYAVFCLKK